MTASLWRQGPVVVRDRRAEARDIARDAIFPSARQALAAVVQRLRLGRLDYIGIPDFTSHCVIDFLGRRGTPVPTRLLPSGDRPGAVLLYDQWGWQRADDRLVDVHRAFPEVPIIWDRVDSLTADPGHTAGASAKPNMFQVFSLSKTLGAGGGGMAWDGTTGWMPAGPRADDAFTRALSAWIDGHGVTGSQRLRMELFFRNECDAWPPRLKRWLDDSSVLAACEQEVGGRRARLAACLHWWGEELPPWMRRAAEDLSLPAPGIFPVSVASHAALDLDAIRAEIGLDLCFYHFDFSESYVEPSWKRILPVPLHSEVALEQLEALYRRLRMSNGSNAATPG
jgi:hypothetical protein